MNWLALLFAVEIGWMPQGTFMMYDKIPNDYYRREAAVLDNSFFTELEAELLFFNMIYIGGGVRTIIYKSMEGYDFDPQAANFDFNLGLKYGPIDIFFRHYCYHPIIAYMYQYETKLNWEGGYSELGIRIKGRIN